VEYSDFDKFYIYVCRRKRYNKYCKFKSWSKKIILRGKEISDMQNRFLYIFFSIYRVSIKSVASSIFRKRLNYEKLYNTCSTIISRDYSFEKIGKAVPQGVPLEDPN